MSRKGPLIGLRDVRLRGGFELRCCRAFIALKQRVFFNIK